MGSVELVCVDGLGTKTAQHAVDAFTLKEEADWEVEGTRRAIQRYQEAAQQADPTTLSPGRAFLRKVIPPLVRAIEQAKVDGEVEIGKKGLHHPWVWLIQHLPADVLAVITATTALRDAEPNADTPSQSAVRLARNLAGAIQDEIEYREWVKETDDVDLLARLKRRYPNVERHTWSQWRRQYHIQRSVEWTAKDGVDLGAHLLGLLVQAAPEYFMVVNVSVGAKTSITVCLTDLAKEMLRDLGSRAEVARPQLMPMLMPPLPWRYEDPSRPL